jgi:DNA polymerase
VSALELQRVGAVSCVACRLASTRTQVVFGAGDPHADVMIIGEGPGEPEDERGTPFAGVTAQLLDELLAVAGLSRDLVWLTNLLLCRTPGNRLPGADEIKACEHHLFAQIDAVGPRLVAPLGGFVASLFTGSARRIDQTHGQPAAVWISEQRVLLYPLLPLATCRVVPGLRKRARADFARIPELLAQADELLAWAAEGEAEDPQLELDWGAVS